MLAAAKTDAAGSMTELVGRTILITGAGGGFGRHMVRQFRDAGARLALTDLTDDHLSEPARDAGDALVATVSADLSTEAGCDAVAAACEAADIVPDVIVNNAGIAAAGRLDHVPRSQWETLMQLNLLWKTLKRGQGLESMKDLLQLLEQVHWVLEREQRRDVN